MRKDTTRVESFGGTWWLVCVGLGGWRVGGLVLECMILVEICSMLSLWCGDGV